MLTWDIISIFLIVMVGALWVFLWAVGDGN